MKNKNELSKRERQVMDIVYANGSVSVSDVQSYLPDEPTYSATRMLMQRLQKKELLTFVMDGPKYIYSASAPRQTAGRAALAKLMNTFFDGSKTNTFNALLGISSETLSDEELDELEQVIAKAKEKRK